MKPFQTIEILKISKSASRTKLWGYFEKNPAIYFFLEKTKENERSPDPIEVSKQKILRTLRKPSFGSKVSERILIRMTNWHVSVKLIIT